jgi:diaminopropionate ammonia-lyase
MNSTPRPTPLLDHPALADRLGVARVWVKDEGKRALGNFKSLGGMAAAEAALDRAGTGDATLICASDGNHGLAVAATARARGVRARIYLPRTVNAVRADRIAAFGGEIVRIDGTYDRAVDRARRAAAAGEGLLIPDTSDDIDDPIVADVLAGYGRIPREIIAQLDGDRPTHLFVQAGVGGLAAAVSVGLQRAYGDDMSVAVVEPAAAACVAAGLAAGRPVQIAGTLETCADMLSCGLASASALAILLRMNCRSIAVSEEALIGAVAAMKRCAGLQTTPSGAAGLAGAMVAADDPYWVEELGLNASSRILLLMTER